MNRPLRIIVVAGRAPNSFSLDRFAEADSVLMEHGWGTTRLDPRTGASQELRGTWADALVGLECQNAPLALELTILADAGRTLPNPVGTEWAVLLEDLVVRRGRKIDHLVLADGFVASLDLALEMADAAHRVTARAPEGDWVSLDLRGHPRETWTDPLLSCFFQLGRWWVADPKARSTFVARLSSLPDSRPWLSVPHLQELIAPLNGPESLKAPLTSLASAGLPLLFPRNADQWQFLRPRLGRSRPAQASRADRAFDELFLPLHLAA